MTKIHNDCLICDRIGLIAEGNNPYFVRELKTGFVVIGDHQFYRGYTLFLCKEHKRELHELDPQFRKDYLWEMSVVAEAVFKAFNPKKLNYELLGNTDEHMHWHLFPRYADDSDPKRPVWVVDKEIRKADSTKPDFLHLRDLKLKLDGELSKLLDLETSDLLVDREI